MGGRRYKPDLQVVNTDIYAFVPVVKMLVALCRRNLCQVFVAMR